MAKSVSVDGNYLPFNWIKWWDAYMNHFDYMAPVEVFNNHFTGFSDHWHDEFKKKNFWTKLVFPNFQNHVSDDVTATLESHPPGLLLP